MKLTRPHDDFSPEAGLARWYRDRPLGQRLVRQLTAQLNQELEQIFGYHTVAVGPEIGLPLDKMSKTQRVFRLCTNEPVLVPSESVKATAETMPFATDSVDALILCHTLDATPVPHQVLRECQRVLVPNGHLIIVSFNALSLWGGVNWLRRFLPGKRRRVAGHGSRKLCDWLSLLGFASADPRFLASFSPRGQGRVARVMDRLDQWLVSLNSPTGAIYLIHARKRVSQYLDSSHVAGARPRLISIPLGKSREGVPVPRELGRVQCDPLESPP